MVVKFGYSLQSMRLLVNFNFQRFGVQSVKRILNWMKSKQFDKNSEIIDIGCGNGFTCYKLVRYCFEPFKVQFSLILLFSRLKKDIKIFLALIILKNL